MKTAIKTYTLSHLRELPNALKELGSTKMASMMTLLVIGIALSLPCIFMMLFTNVKTLANNLESAPQISVFLKGSASEDKIKLLEQTFKADPNILKVHYVSKEAALKKLSKGLNDQNILSLLSENPLPPVFVLDLPLTMDEKTLQAFTEALHTLPEVESAMIDIDWVKRLGAGLKVLDRLVTGLTFILSLAVLLVIGNTLRLHIENKKNTIEVAKLVGATDAFVRRPFLYLGLWYGALGALMAMAITLLLFFWLKNAASELLLLYQNSLNQAALQFHGLDFQNVALLFLLGSLLGVGGAWLSVGRHLR